jgi:hypothetical protein
LSLVADALVISSGRMVRRGRRPVFPAGIFKEAISGSPRLMIRYG